MGLRVAIRPLMVAPRRCPKFRDAKSEGGIMVVIVWVALALTGCSSSRDSQLLRSFAMYCPICLAYKVELYRLRA